MGEIERDREREIEREREIGRKSVRGENESGEKRYFQATFETEKVTAINGFRISAMTKDQLPTFRFLISLLLLLL